MAEKQDADADMKSYLGRRAVEMLHLYGQYREIDTRLDKDAAKRSGLYSDKELQAFQWIDSHPGPRQVIVDWLDRAKQFKTSDEQVLRWSGAGEIGTRGELARKQTARHIKEGAHAVTANIAGAFGMFMAMKIFPGDPERQIAAAEFWATLGEMLLGVGEVREQWYDHKHLGAIKRQEKVDRPPPPVGSNLPGHKTFRGGEEKEEHGTGHEEHGTGHKGTKENENQDGTPGEDHGVIAETGLLPDGEAWLLHDWLDSGGHGEDGPDMSLPGGGAGHHDDALDPGGHGDDGPDMSLPGGGAGPHDDALDPGGHGEDGPDMSLPGGGAGHHDDALDPGGHGEDGPDMSLPGGGAGHHDDALDPGGHGEDGPDMSLPGGGAGHHDDALDPGGHGEDGPDMSLPGGGAGHHDDALDPGGHGEDGPDMSLPGGGAGHHDDALDPGGHGDDGPDMSLPGGGAGHHDDALDPGGHGDHAPGMSSPGGGGHHDTSPVPAGTDEAMLGMD